jgi:aspartate/methionine/tyrosine aminotransferase
VSFSPPPYPYERLDVLKKLASAHEGGPIDCSIGTPIDAPPDAVLRELAMATGARGYPTSQGSLEFRSSAAHWIERRFGVVTPVSDVAACIGTKEFVGTLAGYLHLRSPERDTVLYPSISYPTYAMGATLAGLRAVPVAVRDGRLDLASIDAGDVARALVLWSNSPSNPTGFLDDLEAIAAWGRRHDVLVASDECYAEYTWAGRPRSILEHGSDGVIAVHSSSKRSNLAGLRAGLHAGFMVPAPIQAAVAVSYDDDEHVAIQRERYRARLALMSEALGSIGVSAPMPEGSFYLWCSKEGLDGWTLASEIAERSALVVSPGELYGDDGHDFVRLAVVQSDERLAVAAARLRND